jgi:hypothetical protein
MKEGIEVQPRERLIGRYVGRSGITLLGLCLWLACMPAAVAQSKADTPPVVARDDRAPVSVRYPKQDHLRDLQTDRDYQYSRDAPPPENPLARLWQWLLRKIGDFLSSESYQNVWQYVLLVVIAGVAIYLLMKAEVLNFLFPKKAESASLTYENLGENIHELDFKLAIEEAVSLRNFRLAVRLLYLQTLKHLTDSGRIQYKPDKTNRQYVNELASSSIRPDFERLTSQFEFVWYGDFPIDEAQFATIRTAFAQFNKADQPQPTT